MLWTFLKIRLTGTGKTKQTVLPMLTKHSVTVNCEKLGLRSWGKQGPTELASQI